MWWHNVKRCLSDLYHVPLSSQVLDDAEEDDGCLEDEASLNERRLVSRYGVWLLVGLCTPEPDTPMSTFGHMLSMLFQVRYIMRKTSSWPHRISYTNALGLGS